MKTSSKTQSIAMIGMFTAVLAVLSILQIPNAVRSSDHAADVCRCIVRLLPRYTDAVTLCVARYI